MTEPTGVEHLMELMLQMKQEDMKREERRERERELEIQRREQQDRDREVQREERQAALLAQLKEAQPTVPQQITIHKEDLPKLREKDNLELFIHQLEAALVASEVPRHKWKRYIHSQLTLDSKQKVMPLLQDATSSYEDIRAALMGCSAILCGHG